MRKIVARLVILSLTVATGLSVPVARAEGGQSAGHGIKCYWVPVVQANGTTVYQQVCRKGI